MNYEDKIKIFEDIPKDSIGAEVGVHEGNFSQYILDCVEPRKLFLIDPWILQDRPGSWYDKTKVSNNEMQSRFEKVRDKFASNDRVKIIRKKSEEVDEIIPDNFLDFVYLDGDHSYDGVCKDFDVFYKKVKPNGYILGDDYFVGKWWKDSIIKAVDYNIKTKNIKMMKVLGSQYCCKITKTDN